MGYIDRPVDWLQYALKIKAYANFLIKLWRFENWESAVVFCAMVFGLGRNRIARGFVDVLKLP